MASALSPAFRFAALTGGLASLAVHVKRGDGVNAADKDGRTPLMLAASRGHVEACRLLLEAGANPSILDNRGRDARSLALQCGADHVAALINELSPVRFSGVSLAEAFSIVPEVAVSEGASATPALALADGTLGFWDEDPDATRPAGDAKIIDAAIAAQDVLSVHIPIDQGKDWSDLEMELPESTGATTTFASRGRVRSLFAAAWREGRVSEESIGEAIEARGDETSAPDTGSVFLVLRDLGVEIDTEARSLGADTGYTPPSDDDTEAWEEAESGLTLLDRLISPQVDPLYQYYRDIKKHPLLTRNDEQRLGASIEQAIVNATQALAVSTVVRAELAGIVDGVLSRALPPTDLLETDPDSDFEDISDPPQSGQDGAQNSSWLDTSGGGDPTPTKPPTTEDNLVNLLTPLRVKLTEPATAPDIIAEELVQLGVSWLLVSRLGLLAGDCGDNHTSCATHQALVAARSARGTLVLSNLRLVISVARQYSNSAMPLADMIQDGNIGLMRAAAKFDYKRGNKFSTYATWWIRQSITRGIADRSRTIRVPVHMIERIARLKRRITEAEGTIGRSPEIRDLAEQEEISERAVRKILEIPEEQFTFEDNIPESVLTLDSLGGCPTTFGETIHDSDMRPDEAVELANLQVVVRNAIGSLREQQQRVVAMRFGIELDAEHTLEEIGQQFKVTRERIRQIESKALDRLGVGKNAEALSILAGVSVLSPPTTKKTS